MRTLSHALQSPPSPLPGTRVAIVRSAWHAEIVDRLEGGARKVFVEAGLKANAITTITVPGSFEIPLACRRLIDASEVDGILALGIIVQGQTHHAAEIARACTDGLMRVQLDTATPIAHSVLFVWDLAQAEERSHETHNRGAEAARTLLGMLALHTRGRHPH